MQTISNFIFTPECTKYLTKHRALTPPNFQKVLSDHIKLAPFWHLEGWWNFHEKKMRHYYGSKFLYILVLEQSRIFKNNYQIFINMTIGDKLINKDENINKKIISSTMVFKNLFKQTQTRISKLKCANKLQHFKINKLSKSF